MTRVVQAQSSRERARANTSGRVDMLRQRAARLLQSEEVTISVASRELAHVIDSMLAEIEHQVHRTEGLGSTIAHELRIPLTRTRATLERGRFTAPTLEALQDVVDRGISGLDRAVGIITALLRIADIDHRSPCDDFGQVPLSRIVCEVAELFQPLAEEHDVVLAACLSVDQPATVRGDSDLLFEAIANLVDNAIKFTPPGGRVELALTHRGGGWAVRVADSGPGIPEAEREAVTRPFYRAKTNRKTRGIGLGLTLVVAIVRLHGFQLSIGGGPGCVVELVCSLGTGA